MIHGIINVYKEKGYTSHDVVAKLRGMLQQKKIGHTGTLDPDAEGVLPVCLGQGTKLYDMLTDTDKTYHTVCLLGVTTDTQDISGKIIEEKVLTISEDRIREVIESYIGDYMQIPPMYSAVKRNGKKLYELAREGKEVERSPRKVRIYSMIIHRIDLLKNEAELTVKCSKGTYIRTLCHDIGKELGCGGCMKTLIRTQVGSFPIEESLTLHQIEKLVQEGRIQEKVYPLDAMFQMYEWVQAEKEARNQIDNGNFIKSSQLKHTEKVAEEAYIRLYDDSGRFIGIYQRVSGEDRYQPVKLFLEK